MNPDQARQNVACRRQQQAKSGIELYSVLSGTPPGCQIVWIQIRPSILLGLILIQTVCKGDWVTTLIGKEKLKLKFAGMAKQSATAHYHFIIIILNLIFYYAFSKTVVHYSYFCCNYLLPT